MKSLRLKRSNRIVTALSVKLTSADDKKFTQKGTDNIKAYDNFLKALNYYYRTTPEDFKMAISHYKKAIELDPNFSRAYAALGIVYQVGDDRMVSVIFLYLSNG